MSKIVKFDSSDTDKHSLAMDIRMTVFVREQGVDASIEEEYEEESTHFLLYYRRKPVATARYRFTAEGIKLERFAMLKAWRGKGLGNDLLRYVLHDALRYKQKIYLHSQAQVKGYYQKRGFVEEGQRFEEAGIAHVKMVYKPVSKLNEAMEKAICRR